MVQVERLQAGDPRERGDAGDVVAIGVQCGETSQARQRRNVGDVVAAEVQRCEAVEAAQRRKIRRALTVEVQNLEVDGVFDPGQARDACLAGVCGQRQRRQRGHVRGGDRLVGGLCQQPFDLSAQHAVGDGDRGSRVRRGARLCRGADGL